MFITQQNYPREQVCVIHGDIYNCNSTDIVDIDDIKNLSGDYCLAICKEDKLILATDPFRTKLLFLNIDPDNRTFAVSHDPREIKKLGLTPYLLEENTIFVLDLHTFAINKQENHTWDLTQKDSTHTRVFEAFEHAISNRFNNKTKLLMSSGYDSGATACALHKQGNVNFSISWLDLDDNGEDRRVLGERLQLHKGKLFKHKKRDISNIQNMFLYPNMNDGLAESYAATLEYMKTIEMDSIIVAHGGAFYNDYGFQGEQFGVQSIFGGLFPKQLELIYPRKLVSLIELTGGIDLFGTYYQCTVKQAILDINLVQAWIHTKPELKNKRDRNWMYEYMKDHNYPMQDAFLYTDMI